MFCGTGESRSEGGFLPNKVSAASLLDASKATDKQGKTYFKYELLTRSGEMTALTAVGVSLLQGLSQPDLCTCKMLTDACLCAADGNEGGRHQLVTAAVSNGTLYICKVRALLLYLEQTIIHACMHPAARTFAAVHADRMRMALPGQRQLLARHWLC